MNSLLSCRHLCKVYQESKLTTEVLKDVSFELQAREAVAIVGSSGSGKSTLLHLLGGLESPTAGEIFFQGQDIHQLSTAEKAHLRNQKFGFIYQFHHLLPDFNALENVAMPLLIGGSSITSARQKAHKILIQVGLASRTEHRPAELSGGERQRVAIARALVNQPALVFADEPTGNLDEKTAEDVFALMTELNAQQGTAFLVVTHDRRLANRLDKQLEMRHGQLHVLGE